MSQLPSSPSEGRTRDQSQDPYRDGSGPRPPSLSHGVHLRMNEMNSQLEALRRTSASETKSLRDGLEALTTTMKASETATKTLEGKVDAKLKELQSAAGQLTEAVCHAERLRSESQETTEANAQREARIAAVEQRLAGLVARFEQQCESDKGSRGLLDGRLEALTQSLEGSKEAHTLLTGQTAQAYNFLAGKFQDSEVKYAELKQTVDDITIRSADGAGRVDNLPGDLSAEVTGKMSQLERQLDSLAVSVKALSQGLSEHKTATEAISGEVTQLRQSWESSSDQSKRDIGEAMQALNDQARTWGL